MTAPEIPQPGIFLGQPIHPVTVSAFQEIVLYEAPRRKNAGAPPLLCGYLNAHCSNLAERNPSYGETLRRFDIVYPDGQGLVWGARKRGINLPERVNAGDFIVDFCRKAAREGLQIYLLGSYPGLAEKTADRWRQQAPGLHIVGTQDGFFEAAQEDARVQAINASGADLLIVGMGSPKQEAFALRNAAHLRVGAIWCVGALFEYFSDKRWRAPVWMRRIGLEWLFRLAMEPRRLWKRYIVGNALFIWRVWRRPE